MIIKQSHLLFALLFLFGAHACNSESIAYKISITNPSDLKRESETIEIPLATGQDLAGKKGVSSLLPQNGMNSLKNMRNWSRHP